MSLHACQTCILFPLSSVHSILHELVCHGTLHLQAVAIWVKLVPSLSPIETQSHCIVEFPVPSELVLLVPSPAGCTFEHNWHAVPLHHGIRFTVSPSLAGAQPYWIHLSLARQVSA